MRNQRRISDTSESTEHGVIDHRAVCSVEELIRGLEAIGVGPDRAVGLATAHTMRLESIRWWKARGYDVGEHPSG